MARVSRANPLALAVLACLYERPMHPYEMATLLRERGKHESIKINYGSLYSVVESLQKNGLIDRQEREREGRRPERTVYRLAEAGSVETVNWLSELLSIPVKEYTRYEAGLSLMPVLPPEDVVALLEERCRRLKMGVAAAESSRKMASETGLPKLVLVEMDYQIAMRKTELMWTRDLAEEIGTGKLEGIELWRRFLKEGGSADWRPGALRNRGKKRGLKDVQ
jgi:DNA-binding PadR family transcriptional regulator